MEREVELPDTPPVLVANGFAIADRGIDMKYYRSISYTRPHTYDYTGESDALHSGVSESIWVNGSLISNPQSYHLRPGDHVRVQARYGSMPAVESSLTMPSRPEVGKMTIKTEDRIEYKETSLFSQYGFSDNLVSVHPALLEIPFRALATQGHFYRIVLEYCLIYDERSPNYQLSGMWKSMTLTDPVIHRFGENSNLEIFWNQSSYSKAVNLIEGTDLPSGGDYTLKHPLEIPIAFVDAQTKEVDQELTDNILPRQVQLRATLYAITPDLYRYWVSLVNEEMSSKNILDVLSEPVPIYTNIEGGLGILGGMTPSDTLLYDIPLR